MKTAEKSPERLPSLHVKSALHKGTGVFTTAPIAAGTLVTELTGFIVPTHKLRADYFALQIDHDLWLCSKGGRLDDMINHSCQPNTGFSDGALKLFALRDIASGEEITFDYSTAMTDAEWSLDCLCEEATCRKTVLPFQLNDATYQQQNLNITLDYIRNQNRSSHARQA